MLPLYHKLITRNALQDIFGEAELQEVISGNLKQDHLAGQFGHPEFHFDDSEFERTHRYQSQLKTGIINNVSAGTSYQEARTDFGRFTHASQDFYAHSNYIRLWAQKHKITPETWNGEIDFMDGEIIHSKELISGHFNPPWEMITFLPFIGQMFIPLFPKDSHAYLNIDSPYKNDWFPLAFKAAEMRTRYEAEQLISALQGEKHLNLVFFLGRNYKHSREYNIHMELKLKLENDLKDAMRSGDEVKKSSIRMVIAAMKLAQVEKGGPLDDQAILSLVQKEIKSRKESIADAEKANRPDLIAAARAEITVLEVYLPAQMSNEELSALAQAAIEETGAILPSDMGKVMKQIMPKVQGRAPNDQISLIVRQLLEKK